jgi:hypothetical protein
MSGVDSSTGDSTESAPLRRAPVLHNTDDIAAEYAAFLDGPLSHDRDGEYEPPLYYKHQQ